MMLLRIFILAVTLSLYSQCFGKDWSVMEKTDSVRFSLLTCEPGREIYALFGHTALRYENYTRRVDIVFNYGMFSFDTPNFVMRFVKGETDYQLGIVPFRYFESEYAMRGSSVYQQVLNLTVEEKNKLFCLLCENYKPENRIYRYNYFFDNCTTRARDCIEQCIDGLIVYPDMLQGKSFRGIVHEFTANSPWSEFGIDLCLGKEADVCIDQRAQMFSPFYMLHYASDAYIVSDKGEKRPLVLEETKVVEGSLDASVEDDFSVPISPWFASCLFAVICVLLAWCQWRHERVCWGWTCFLLILQGGAGCIISFLFFFSVHPTVNSNWLVLLLNPVPLFYAPVMIFKAIKQIKDPFHWINVIYLTLFIAIIPLCGQKINLTVLPLALGLLMNSVAYIMIWNKRK